MIDIQSTPDTRAVPLQKVGVKNVKYPIQVLDKDRKSQNTTGTVNLFVNLPHNFKGTHMSRFIEVFHKYHNDISMNNFLEMLEEIRTKLDAERAFGRITFPYFIEKKAPVTGSTGLMEYTCSYEGDSERICEAGEKRLRSVFSESPEELGSEGVSGKSNFFISIKVPIATLCPCSKAISEYGAHNQRGFVKVKVLYSKFFWIEDVISMIESCASTPLYSVLKRKDEKFVTEHAYDNPRFVEDVVREVYLGLKKMGFKWFNVEAETEESIHFHNAYACAEYSE
ncbi:GTP cyclohydrolase I FolE2 [Treponema sp.]|uniref:GTP cyclohydrolase I FolE2 n=1 Tax=Treponema sp. TaxID=166 RepID=UPI003890721C